MHLHHFHFSPQSHNREHLTPIRSLNPAYREASIQALEDGLQQIVDLLGELSHQPIPVTQITVPTLDGFRVVKLGEILRLESDSNYTRIFLSGEKPFVVSRTLKEFETLLCHKGFFRIHRRHIINLSLVQRYVKGNGGEVILADGTILQVSRARKETFLQHFMGK